MANNTIRNEPLRVPAGWKDQDKALIIQLQRLLDDLFGRFGKLRRKDLGTELNTLLDELIEAAGDLSDLIAFIGDTAMGTTATTVTGAIAEHEGDISGINTKIGSTALPTTAQTLTGAIAEVDGDIGSVAGELSALYSLTVAQLKGK